MSKETFLRNTIVNLEAERDALQAELNKAYQNAAFYRCCALSGETPEEGAEPYPKLEGEG
jgi:hypothetical protein